ncbi:hypothetical protein KAU34_10500 [candidate division WOR-3 bacterium]|nr:hypothetical protein [candidate division WOR-3 bacterium]
MACPVYQSFNEGKTSGATTVVVTKPSGVVEGDLLIGFLSSDGGSETHTSPESGTWEDILVGESEASGKQTFSVWYKIAGASEPSDYTFTCGSSEGMYAWIIRITGHSATSPIHKIRIKNGDSTIVLNTLVATDHDDCLIISAFGADHGDITVDSGWNNGTNITVDESGSGSGDASGGACWINQATAGFTTQCQCSLTDTEEYVSICIAIRSADTGWVTPLGFVDSGDSWDSEENAYNSMIGQGSNTSILAASWSDYLELTVPEVTNCTKMRFYAEGQGGLITSVSIDLYYSSQWNNIFEGAFTDQTWIEKVIGSTQAVTSMRVKFYNNHTSAVSGYLYEGHFWDAGASAVEALISTAAMVVSMTSSLSRGAAEALTSTANIVTSITGALSKGITWALNSTSDIVSSITGVLSRGVTETLTSTSNIVTSITNVLKRKYYLISTSDIVTSTTSSLSRGVTEALTSTSNMATSIIALLGRGITQTLASISDLVTLFTAALTKSGETIVLLSTAIMSTSIASILSRGVAEALTSTSNIVTSIGAKLTRIMDLVSTSNIVSSIASVLSRGITGVLASTPNITTSITGILSRGIAQSLATTSALVISTTSTLSRGIAEALTSTANMATSITGILSRGITQVLTSTSDMVTSITAILSKLLTQLNSVATMTTSFTASLSRGAAEALTSTSAMATSITSILTRGIKRTLVSATNMATSFISSLSRGASEALNSVSNIVISILAKLTSDLMWIEETKKTANYTEEEKKAVGNIVEEEKKTTNWTEE